MTPASSTPPSDAEVIETAHHWASPKGNHTALRVAAQYARPSAWGMNVLLTIIADRLRASNERISSLERELRASDAALLLAWASIQNEHPGAMFADIQTAIEAARRRRAT